MFLQACRNITQILPVIGFTQLLNFMRKHGEHDLKKVGGLVENLCDISHGLERNLSTEMDDPTTLGEELLITYAPIRKI
jgi:hypothetical protein